MSGSSSSSHDLPPVIPVFPLEGTILLPGSNLPLNIFEPRYLKMVKDTHAGHGIIGMVQPKSTDKSPNIPMLYSTGCAGRITHCDETKDGRNIIRLTGICRFLIADELDVMTPYRQIQPNWEAFENDLEPEKSVKKLNREKLMAALKAYLKMKGLAADYDGISIAPDDILVNTLSMIIPFAAAEKQALLEAGNTFKRSETLQQLLVMMTSSTLVEPHKQPS